MYTLSGSWFILHCISVLCLIQFIPTPRRAQITDRAGYFSSDAITSAYALSREIKEEERIQIETFAEIPAGVLKRIPYRPNVRSTFFKQWAREIHDVHTTPGIVILIAKDQNHPDKAPWIEVCVGGAQERVKRRYRDLKEILSWHWQNNSPEIAIQRGLRYVKELPFHEDRPKTARRPDPNSPSVQAWIVFGMLAIVPVCVVAAALIHAFRRFSSAKE